MTQKYFGRIQFFFFRDSISWIWPLALRRAILCHQNLYELRLKHDLKAHNIYYIWVTLGKLVFYLSSFFTLKSIMKAVSVINIVDIPANANITSEPTSATSVV